MKSTFLEVWECAVVSVLMALALIGIVMAWTLYLLVLAFCPSLVKNSSRKAVAK